MKKQIIRLSILLILFSSYSSYSQELVELKKNKSNKIVLKYMFNTGSMMDPAGKEGLTMLTASLISDGGSAQAVVVG